LFLTVPTVVEFTVASSRVGVGGVNLTAITLNMFNFRLPLTVADLVHIARRDATVFTRGSGGVNWVLQFEFRSIPISTFHHLRLIMADPKGLLDSGEPLRQSPLPLLYKTVVLIAKLTKYCFVSLVQVYK